MRVSDVGTLANGSPFMVMEYLEGRDLARLLRARTRLSVSEAVDCVLQACDAIAEAHSLGIVHRDLKPSNLFSTTRADGSSLVKVLDFGIAKVMRPRSDDEGQSVTEAGAMMGSPAYMSPEQLRSARDVDARTDVWALGVILYALMTGASPFARRTYAETAAQVLSGPVPSMREQQVEVPDGLVALIERCLDRRTESRIQSVGEFVEGLRPYSPRDLEPLVSRILRVAPAANDVSMLAQWTAPSEALATTVARAGRVLAPGKNQRLGHDSHDGALRPRAWRLRPLMAVASSAALVGLLVVCGVRTKAGAILSSFSQSHLVTSAAEVEQRASPVAGPVEPSNPSEDVEDVSTPGVRADALSVPIVPLAKARARGSAVRSPSRDQASTPALQPLQSANVSVAPSELDGGRFGRLMENRQ